MSLKLIKRFLLFFTLLFLQAEGGAPPSDTPYLKISVPEKPNIIFSELFKEEEPFIYSRALSVFQEYEKNFPVTFYQKNSLILFSPLRRQTHNAVTHVIPLPVSRIFPSPYLIMDKTAVNNWLTDAFIHETAHIHQLGSRPLLSHLLSYIMPSYLWPVYPNIYFHDLVLEGHAVLLESTYGTGGRLFSGYSRAIAFSQLKNGLSLKRIMNSYDDPLSKPEKYIHGGYFFSYLRRNWTLPPLNGIFSANGRNLIWPIGLYALNRSFKKALGQSFETLFKEYKNFYEPKAREQQSAAGKTLALSQFALPVNSDSDHLFFMISNGKEPPALALVSKKTGEISLRPVDMPLGKVFFIDGKFYSAGYGRTDTLSIRFSLFQDGFIPFKKYNSRYVMDIRGERVLSFKGFDGLKRQNLYLNGEALGDAHSTAVLDEEGGAWYFKQEGENRTLYRNKTPLWAYKGYYGFPVEAGAGEVYFLAPTLYGSGLFVYRGGRALRLSPSDTIVSARRMDGTHFLVCEINRDRFEYKIISTQPFPGGPVLYKYSFQKTGLKEAVRPPSPPLQKTGGAPPPSDEKTGGAPSGGGSVATENRVPIYKGAALSEGRTVAAEGENATEGGRITTYRSAQPSEEGTIFSMESRAPIHKDTNLSQERNGAMENRDTTHRSAALSEKRDDTAEGENVRAPINSPKRSGSPSEEEGKNVTNKGERGAVSEKGRLSADPAGRIKSVYYNSVLNLQLQEITLGWGIKDLFHTRQRPFLYRLTLTDPLGWSALSVQGAFSQSVRRFLALYEYKRFRPAYSFSRQTARLPDKNGEDLKMSYFIAGLKYPLMKTENHGLSFSAIGIHKTLRKGANSKRSLILEPSLSFNFKRRYPFAMYNYRSFHLSLSHQNEYSLFRKRFYPSYGLKWALENEALKGFYIASKGDFRTLRKNADTLSPVLLSGRRDTYALHTLFRETGEGRGGAVKNSLISHWKLKKVIQGSFYPVSFPLALRRYAPFIGFSSFISLNPRAVSPNRRIRQAKSLKGLSVFRFHLRYIFIGAEAELSANHKALVSTGLMGGLLWRERFKTASPSLEGGIYLKARF